jgi:hypothetical protein
VPDLAVAWRFAVLGGLTAGLAVAPFLSFPAASTELVITGLAGAAALGAATPRCAAKPAHIVWLCLLGLALALVGAGVGIARVIAIDGGALDLASGQRVRVTGHVAAVPRRANGNLTVRVDTGDGRLLVEAPEPVPELPVGRAVRATGSVRDPRPWEESWLRRLGIRDVVAAQRIELGAGRRGGVVSLLDAARRGPPPRPRWAEAPILRGRLCCAASCWVRTTSSTRRRWRSFAAPGSATFWR